MLPQCRAQERERLRRGTEQQRQLDSRSEVAEFHVQEGAAGLLLRGDRFANEAFGVFLDDVLSSTPLSVPTIAGLYWLQPRFLALGTGTVQASGIGTLTVGIPSDPALVAARLYFQSVVVGGRFALSNVVDAVISQ